MTLAGVLGATSASRLLIGRLASALSVKGGSVILLVLLMFVLLMFLVKPIMMFGIGTILTVMLIVISAVAFRRKNV